eukprot:450069_1
MATRRICHELKTDQLDIDGKYKIALVDDNNLFEFNGYLIGPPKSPHEGGIYYISLTITEDYPFKPPKVRMLTKIYHPNINENGCIKLDVLHSFWMFNLTINKVCIAIIDLLLNPRTDQGVLNLEIAKQCKDNNQTFREIATIWNYKYAQGKIMNVIDEHNVAHLRAVTINVMKSRYSMIKQAMILKFGNNLGQMFTDILLMYYGKMENEIKECVDYDCMLPFKKSQGPNNMQLIIKRNGRSIDDIIIDINQNDYVYCAKIVIQQKLGIDIEDFLIRSSGKWLQNTKRLRDYDIINKSVICMSHRCWSWGNYQ